MRPLLGRVFAARCCARCRLWLFLAHPDGRGGVGVGRAQSRAMTGTLSYSTRIASAQARKLVLRCCCHQATAHTCSSSHRCFQDSPEAARWGTPGTCRCRRAASSAAACRCHRPCSSLTRRLHNTPRSVSGAQAGQVTCAAAGVAAADWKLSVNTQVAGSAASSPGRRVWTPHQRRQLASATARSAGASSASTPASSSSPGCVVVSKGQAGCCSAQRGGCSRCSEASKCKALPGWRRSPRPNYATAPT